MKWGKRITSLEFSSQKNYILKKRQYISDKKQNKTGPNYYYTKENPICNLKDAGRNEEYRRLYETTITIIIVEFKLYKIKYLKITYNSEEAHK